MSDKLAVVKKQPRADADSIIDHLMYMIPYEMRICKTCEWVDRDTFFMPCCLCSHPICEYCVKTLRDKSFKTPDPKVIACYECGDDNKNKNKNE